MIACMIACNSLSGTWRQMLGRLHNFSVPDKSMQGVRQVQEKLGVARKNKMRTMQCFASCRVQAARKYHRWCMIHQPCIEALTPVGLVLFAAFPACTGLPGLDVLVPPRTRREVKQRFLDQLEQAVRCMVHRLALAWCAPSNREPCTNLGKSWRVPDTADAMAEVFHNFRTPGGATLCRR